MAVLPQCHDFAQEVASDDDPNELMRRRLLDWLDGGGEPDVLAKWLEGYSLPGGLGGEPWERILQGLPDVRKPGFMPVQRWHDDNQERMGKGRPGVVDQLAQRVAAVLELRPDEARLGRRPAELLYNLLKLCAALQRDSILCSQLTAIFRRRKLSGNFRGIDLRGVLTEALIRNQEDGALWPEWEIMLRGEQHRFLPGDPGDGIDGASWMPLDQHTKVPDLKKLGWALARFADYLTPDKPVERASVFEDRLYRLSERWGQTAFEGEFGLMAVNFNWPDWARQLITPPVAEVSPLTMAEEELSRLDEVASTIREGARRQIRNLAIPLRDGIPKNDLYVFQSTGLVCIIELYRGKYPRIADAIARAQSNFARSRAPLPRFSR